jgi:hypothetical protein
MKIYFLLLFGLYVQTFCFAQIGIGQNTPNTQAILDIESPSQGLLLSEVSLTSVTNPSPLDSHQEGMMVYNTATSGTFPDNVYPGLYYNDGSQWTRVDGLESKIGDVKHSFETVDHAGWYLLDGRLLTALPEKALLNAEALGFVTNLPNSGNLFWKGVSSAVPFGELAGSNAIILNRGNLPNITYNVNTTSDGAHTHSYTDAGSTMWHGSSGSALTGFNTVNSSRTTGSGGAHSHTYSISSGGSGTPINFIPRYMVVQSFIYLGY